VTDFGRQICVCALVSNNFLLKKRKKEKKNSENLCEQTKRRRRNYLRIKKLFCVRKKGHSRPLKKSLKNFTTNSVLNKIFQINFKVRKERKKAKDYCAFLGFSIDVTNVKTSTSAPHFNLHPIHIHPTTTKEKYRQEEEEGRKKTGNFTLISRSQFLHPPQHEKGKIFIRLRPRL
jgi:hypothetical protein